MDKTSLCILRRIYLPLSLFYFLLYCYKDQIVSQVKQYCDWLVQYKHFCGSTIFLFSCLIWHSVGLVTRWKEWLRSTIVQQGDCCLSCKNENSYKISGLMNIDYFLLAGVLLPEDGGHLLCVDRCVRLGAFRPRLRHNTSFLGLNIKLCLGSPAQAGNI